MKDVHPRIGSFDTVRLIAALMVLHGHMYAIAGLNQPTLPGGTFGAIAVVVFFVVSGYWVSQSALRRTLAAFASARALRIVPGLAVCCLVTILACSLATSLPVNEYLRNAKTWEYMWNSIPFFHIPVIGVPGVFEDGAVKEAPNGSLWTLRYEVMCYVFVGLAAVFGQKGLRAFMAAAAIYGIAVAALSFGGQFEQVNTRYVVLTDFLQVGWIANFAGAFAYGAWLYGQDERRLRQILGVSAVALAMGYKDVNYALVAGLFFYGALAVWVGRNLNLDRRVTRGQDISYGVYIYAFPCQQLAVRWVADAAGAGFLTYYAVSLGATLVLATLSWLLVERPALLLKGPVARTLERSVAGLQAFAARRLPRNRRELAEQAGGLGLEVDAVDPNPVLGRSAGH